MGYETTLTEAQELNNFCPLPPSLPPIHTEQNKQSTEENELAGDCEQSNSMIGEVD